MILFPQRSTDKPSEAIHVQYIHIGSTGLTKPNACTFQLLQNIIILQKSTVLRAQEELEARIETPDSGKHPPEGV